MDRIAASPISDETRWRAVAARDPAADGRFVYAVASTGIYCRPSCPSRRPRRDRVRFFPRPADAEAAGFRPCRRCRPRAASSPAVAAVARACRLIDAHPEGMPPLAAVAAHVGLSPSHLQRTFVRVLGLSPRRYAEAKRLGRLKESLQAGEPVAGAMYEAGFGAPSRLYEKAAAGLGMTPGSYAKGGRGAEIAFTTVASPLGRMLVAATAKGIVRIALGDDDRVLEADLRRDLPQAQIARDKRALAGTVAAVLARLDGRAESHALPLDVRATAFQWRVWRALSDIPFGETRTYAEIARAIGQPKAARAVGRACGSNQVAVVIPCHRAIAADGGLSGYRWGRKRKQSLLTREAKAAPGAAIKTGRA